jgi:hypothetical protein
MTDTERPDPDHDPQNETSGPDRSGDGCETGYGKPPLATRFRKGQSGNPRGRPRGARDMRNILKDALNGKVPVSDAGRRRTMTRKELLVHKLIAKAAAGDMRALLALMAIMERQDGNAEDATPVVLTIQDQATLDRAAAREGYIKRPENAEAADNGEQ